MTMILGIDPGPENSYWLKWDTENQKIIDKGISLNTKFTLWSGVDVVVIEDIQCFGMPVGKSIFETAKAIGRFLERAENDSYSLLISTVQVTRREIKLHFCNSVRAKDSNIRQAILDRFGGKEKAIGKKSCPGILYGVKSDFWSALALCLWYGNSHNLELGPGTDGRGGLG